jgi:cysteine desulfurase / selenocysteine lyase
MTPEEARQSFPGLEDKVYLDAAAMSLMPVEARDAVQSLLDLAVGGDAEDGSYLHIAMDLLRRRPIAEAARLLNTEKENVALVESTTHGLNIAAAALPLRPGDNVLVADTEFLQVAIPWATLPESAGVEMRPVATHDEGVLTPEAFEAAMDDLTRAVCVSSVQWCSGYRVDIAGISELCRARDIWLVVDAIQEMGVLEIDLSTQYADFLMAGGHKWLNAPFGCGVLFVGDRALEELRPPAFGYLALEAPPAGWGEYFRTPDITPFRPYDFRRTAKRFEIAGTSNYPGAAALGASLALLNEVGIAQAEAQVRRLTELLHEELNALGARVVSKRDPAHRSGITIFRMHDDPAEDLRVLNAVLAERILFSIRYTAGVGGLRASTHYYNSEDDVLRLCEALRRHR